MILLRQKDIFPGGGGGGGGGGEGLALYELTEEYFNAAILQHMGNRVFFLFLLHTTYTVFAI